MSGPHPVHPLRNHPLRDVLVNEVHARPTVPVLAPHAVSHLAVLTGEHAAAESHAHLVRLCERHGVVPPAEGVNHVVADLGRMRLRWERHTEFVTYTFFAEPGAGAPFAAPPIGLVPRDWLATVPGEVLVALHLVLLRQPEPPRDGAAAAASAAHLFAPDSLIGSRMAGGIATALTDCRIHEDGFGRILLMMHGAQADLRARQTGRLVQRLLEIETYRTMALLGLPQAREATPLLADVERELAGITAALAPPPGSGRAAPDHGAERGLLDRLASLAAEVERLSAQTSYRFGATGAYAALVGRRIAELREERLSGLQTLAEFMERRLQPALRTCEAVATRQESLSRRLTRTAQLLRTRIEMTLQEQNRDLLRSMNRRARLQLRLQETVEGLSVVAISYYAVALIGHVVEALAGDGRPWLVRTVPGIAVPVVLGVVWVGMRRMRAGVGVHERAE